MRSQHAEGAARAVRHADGAVAGAGGASGRRRQGGRRRLAGACARQQVLPEGVELAVQERPDGTGGAVAPRWRQLGDGARHATAPVRGAQRATSRWSARRRSRSLFEAHAGSGAAATMATTILEDPSGYGRVVRDATARSRGSWRPRSRATPRRPSARFARSTRASSCSTRGALRRALPRLSAENAQGELYLPQVLDLLRADGATVAAHVVEDERLVLGVNDRVGLARVRGARAAGDPRAPHARRGRRSSIPRATVIDVDVRDRRRTR